MDVRGWAVCAVTVALAMGCTKRSSPEDGGRASVDEVDGSVRTSGGLAIRGGDGGVLDAAVAPTPSCPPSVPSFAHDVMPVLQRGCAVASACHMRGDGPPGSTPMPLWFGPPAPLVPTPEELDLVHAGLLGDSAVNVGARPVLPGYPDASILMFVLDLAMPCTEAICGWTHTQIPIASDVTPDEVRTVGEWITAGAIDDSCSVAPPSTTPLLRVPLLVHAGQSRVDPATVVTYVDEANAIASRAGICLEAEVVESEQQRADVLQLWIDPPEGRLYYQNELSSSRGSVLAAASATGLNIARAMLGAREPTLTQREILDARADLAKHARSGAPADCRPPRVVEAATCGDAVCDAFDTGFADTVLPPCCREEGGAVDGGVGAYCGVEPFRMEGILPRWSGPEACATLEGLFAPSDGSPTALDPACPDIHIPNVPIFGDLDLAGCCTRDSVFATTGTCGGSSASLPATLWESPECLRAGSLEETLGPLLPGIGSFFTGTACTPQ